MPDECGKKDFLSFFLRKGGWEPFIRWGKHPGKKVSSAVLWEETRKCAGNGDHPFFNPGTKPAVNPRWGFL
jgi:hypothetical protein